jgi:flagellar basal-body rod protein FlgC
MNGNSMSVFDISGRAMAAQLVRLEHDGVEPRERRDRPSGSEAKRVSFAEARLPRRDRTDEGQRDGRRSISVTTTTNGADEAARSVEPSAGRCQDGDVWDAAVDSAAELVEMVETSRQYQNNVQVLRDRQGH